MRVRNAWIICVFLAVAAYLSVAAPSAAWGESLVHAGRLGDTAVRIDPISLAYGGAQSSFNGTDISMGLDYAYTVTNGEIVQLDSDTLAYTGLATGNIWTSGGASFLSVDVGADGYVYGARDGDTAVRIDPLTLAYAGVQSSHNGVDISVGPDYAYLAQANGTDTILLLDKNTLAYAGVQTNWGGGHIFTSVDVGADGYVYGARAGDSAVKIDPSTLAYAGVQSSHNGVDISVGPDYAYLVQADGTDTILLLDKDTLAYAGAQTNWGGGHIMTSVDVAVPVPEPGTLVLLLAGLLCLGTLMRRRR